MTFLQQIFDCTFLYFKFTPHDNLFALFVWGAINSLIRGAAIAFFAGTIAFGVEGGTILASEFFANG